MTSTRLFTQDYLFAAIEMYLEFHELHGKDREAAKFAAVNEMCEGYDAAIDLHDNDENVPLPLGEQIQRQVPEPYDHEGCQFCDGSGEITTKDGDMLPCGNRPSDPMLCAKCNRLHHPDLRCPGTRSDSDH